MPNAKPYIQLRTHGVGNYKFATVPFHQYTPIIVQNAVHRRTVTGALSSEKGKSYRRFQMVLRIPHTSKSRDGLSSIMMSDLETWFGSDSWVNMTLDFKPFDDSQTFTVRVMEALSQDYVTPVIDATDSYFHVPIVLETI